LQDEERAVDPMDEWDEPIASSDDVERFYEHLHTTLEQLDFYNRDNPGQMLTRMRRLFNRARLDRMELNILRGVLSEVQKKIK